MPKIPLRPVFIGVDPGGAGGLAVVWDGQDITQIPWAVPMPKTDKDVLDWLSTFKYRSAFAAIERVSGFIGTPHPGSAMFKFGRSYGALLMALTAAGIPFEEVTPQRWQKGLGIPSRKRDEPKGRWKNRLKAKAQQLFPSANVTLATADALLIAEYCRRKEEGKL